MYLLKRLDERYHPKFLKKFPNGFYCTHLKHKEKCGILLQCSNPDCERLLCPSCTAYGLKQKYYKLLMSEITSITRTVQLHSDIANHMRQLFQISSHKIHQFLDLENEEANKQINQTATISKNPFTILGVAISQKKQLKQKFKFTRHISETLKIAKLNYQKREDSLQERKKTLKSELIYHMIQDFTLSITFLYLTIQNYKPNSKIRTLYAKYCKKYSPLSELLDSAEDPHFLQKLYHQIQLINHPNKKQKNQIINIYRSNFKAVFTYDLQKQIFTRFNVPEKNQIPLLATSFAKNNEEVFLCGGKEKKYFATTLKLFFNEGFRLEQKANMIVPKCFFQATTIQGNYIYTAGGELNDGFIDVCEKYDIQNDRWEQIQKTTQKMKDIGLCGFSPCYLFKFGGNSINGYKTSFEYLDVEEPESCWEKINVFGLSPRSNCALIQISPEHLLIFGGRFGARFPLDSFIYNTTEGKLEKCEQISKNAEFGFNNPFMRDGIIYAFCTQTNLHMFSVSDFRWNFIPHKKR